MQQEIFLSYPCPFCQKEITTGENEGQTDRSKRGKQGFEKITEKISEKSGGNGSYSKGENPLDSWIAVMPLRIPHKQPESFEQLEKFVSKKHKKRNESAHVEHHIHKYLRFFQSEQVLEEHKMPRAADGKKFCQTLDNP
jgi:hypothetical protein